MPAIGPIVLGGAALLMALRQALGYSEKVSASNRAHDVEMKKLDIQRTSMAAELRAKEKGLALKRQMLIENMAELRRRESEEKAAELTKSAMQIGANQTNVQLALLNQLSQTVGGVGPQMSSQRAMLPLSLMR